MTVDPYVDPENGVLRNRLSVADSPRLQEVEAELTVVERATHYLAEVNAIHPFREGNGRTQRAFFGQVSRDAGWPIDWAGLDPHRNTSASMSSLRGDNEPLRDLIDSLTAY